MKSFPVFTNTKPALPAVILTVLAVALTACAGTGRTGQRGYLAEPVVIGEGGRWELNGMLTLPRAASAARPVPAVVLVHGSGAADMDSGIAGNRPFFDIASRLSANGVAVIRYDKRTLTHGARMLEELGGSLTVREETIEDALLAAGLLRRDPRIDGNRIFLLGLSMGAMLAPRIHAQEGGGFAGLILLAGSPRLLSDILVEQLRTQVNLVLEDGPEKDAQLAQVDGLAGLFASAAGMTGEQAKAVPVIGGASLYYFRDFMMHPFEYYAAAVDVPVLVMQGGRDFQVLADVDFAMLRDIFAGHDNVTFKLYDGLNHLFMPTDAADFMEHATGIMETTGTVAAEVLRDITEWILSW